MITAWTNLKRDSHVRLACGCEGFIKSIHFERDVLQSGFVMTHTVLGCHKPESCYEKYLHGEGPFSYFFAGNMAEESMPAEIVPIPNWWKEIESTKTNPEQKMP